MPESRKRKKKYKPSMPNKPTRRDIPSQYDDGANIKGTPQQGVPSSLSLHHFKAELSFNPYAIAKEVKDLHDLNPAYGEIFLQHFKEEGDHRRKMENLMVSDVPKERRETLFFGILGLSLVLGAGIWFMLEGHAVAGAGIITAVAAVVVTVLVTRKSTANSNGEKQNKKEK